MTLPELKELAQAATPGKWTVDEKDDWYGVESDADPTGWICCEHDDNMGGPSKENAHYIAAANPATVLDLITRVEKLTEALEGYVLGDPIEGFVDDAGEFGREELSKYGADVPLGAG